MAWRETRPTAALFARKNDWQDKRSSRVRIHKAVDRFFFFFCCCSLARALPNLPIIPDDTSLPFSTWSA